MSQYVRPHRARRRGIANAGAISNPSVRKSTAAISQSTSFAAMEFAGSFARPALDATHRLAAPSVSGDELPAVSVPRPLVRSNDGASVASFSGDVSLRG